MYISKHIDYLKNTRIATREQFYVIVQWLCQGVSVQWICQRSQPFPQEPRWHDLSIFLGWDTWDWGSIFSQNRTQSLNSDHDIFIGQQHKGAVFSQNCSLIRCGTRLLMTITLWACLGSSNLFQAIEKKRMGMVLSITTCNLHINNFCYLHKGNHVGRLIKPSYASM